MLDKLAAFQAGLLGMDKQAAYPGVETVQKANKYWGGNPFGAPYWARKLGAVAGKESEKAHNYWKGNPFGAVYWARKLGTGLGKSTSNMNTNPLIGAPKGSAAVTGKGIYDIVKRQRAAAQ